MGKRFLITWLSIFVLWMIGSFIVHGSLLYADYASLPNLFRPEADAQHYFPLMILAHVILSGAFGYEGRVDYTAIGTVVNLAARLCGEAEGGTIVVDRRMRAALDDSFAVEPLGGMTLNGYAQPVPAFRLRGTVSAAA